MAAISVPLLLLFPSYLNSDPPSYFNTDSNGEEEFEECNTLTVIDYGNTGKPNRWMTPQYLSLQICCSGLMRDEAHRALKHHFRGESNENLHHLFGVGKKTKWAHGNEIANTISADNSFGESLLPALLAVGFDDCKLGSELLRDSSAEMGNGNRTVGDPEQKNHL